MQVKDGKLDLAMNEEELKSIARALVAPRKGILAADESFPTIKKRFDAIGVESNEENRKAYRELLFTTEGIEEFISGVIMFDETIRQTTKDGKPFAKVLQDTGIIPGIKVDKGAVSMANFAGEKITEGLDGLRERLAEYKSLGAKFTKWRAVITIGENIPTNECIDSNAESLARFAAASQEAGMVPIVEPEVLMDGGHDIEKSKEVGRKTLKSVFLALGRHKVTPEAMLLKPSWAHPGKDNPQKSSDEEIAEATLNFFKEVLPDELPGVVFLSGGDSPEDSTLHLNAMNQIGSANWELSFSFGRALQELVLQIWGGKEENIKLAQESFYKRAKLNSMARAGEYRKEMETS